MSAKIVEEIKDIGKVYVIDLGDKATKICANIADYTEICLTLEMRALRSEAEKNVMEYFKKYKEMLIQGFINGLKYIATLISVEAKAEKSVMYM